MSTELDAVRDACPSVAPASDQARAIGRQRLAAAIADEAAGRHGHRRRKPRRRWWIATRGALAPAVSVLVVAGIVAVVILSGHRGAGAPSAAQARSVTLVYRAEPTPRLPRVTRTALRHTISIIKSRARAFGLAPVQIRARGANEIVVKLSGGRDLSRIANTLVSNPQLEFYDWEANAILPDGKSVASQLPLQNQKALLISQGRVGTGSPGAGGMSLYDAVKLASKQPAQTTHQLSRLGNEYFLFGRPGSRACTTAAHDKNAVPVKGQWCYLAGLGGDGSIQQLKSEPLPEGVSYSQGTVLTVPQGWVILQAANLSASSAIEATSPQARYFVLRDQPALSGEQISNPTATTTNGQPAVRFGFTNGGARAFQNLTANIARRGSELGTRSNPMFQHFAVEVDGQLLSVPEIDYKQYPDGIVSSTAAASIQGSFTTQSARDLAAQLAFPDALSLKLIGKTAVPG